MLVLGRTRKGGKTLLREEKRRVLVRILKVMEGIYFAKSALLFSLFELCLKYEYFPRLIMRFYYFFPISFYLWEAKIAGV